MFMLVLARRDQLGVVLSAHAISIPVKEAAGIEMAWAERDTPCHSPHAKSPINID